MSQTRAVSPMRGLPQTPALPQAQILSQAQIFSQAGALPQAQTPRSEFLGLHDPYGDAPAGAPVLRPPPGPLVTREKAGELVRAGGALVALFMLIAVVITALG